MENRLIACANFLPITSTYWWKGAIEHSSEIVSIVKTTKENWEKVKEAVIALHHYETLLIMKL